MVVLKEQQQPGDTSIAVTERMNAQKIKIEGRQGNQGMYPSLLQKVSPGFNQGRHILRHILCGNSTKSDPLAAIGIFFDDVTVLVLVLSGIPDFTAAKTVK